MNPTERRVLLQALAAIDACRMPPEPERRLLQELRARFGTLPGNR